MGCGGCLKELDDETNSANPMEPPILSLPDSTTPKMV